MEFWPNLRILLDCFTSPVHSQKKWWPILSAFDGSLTSPNQFWRKSDQLCLLPQEVLPIPPVLKGICTNSAQDCWRTSENSRPLLWDFQPIRPTLKEFWPIYSTSLYLKEFWKILAMPTDFSDQSYPCPQKCCPIPPVVKGILTNPTYSCSY